MKKILNCVLEVRGYPAEFNYPCFQLLFEELLDDFRNHGINNIFLIKNNISSLTKTNTRHINSTKTYFYVNKHYANK